MPRLTFAAPLFSGVLGLGLLAGCADMQDNMRDLMGNENNEPRTIAYKCDDDRDFTARFSDDRDRVVVDTGGESYDLDYADRDDGRRVYGKKNDVYLVVDERNAYLRVPGGSDFKDCERRS